MNEAFPDRITIVEYRNLLASGTSVKPKRRKSPEEDLHRACFEWTGLMQPRHPILRWMIHVPNGGKRPKGEAGKLKAMGAKKGVPDLILPRIYRGWSGFASELKSDTGRVSDDQEEWLEAFREDGYLTCVCRSIEHYQREVMRFLKGKS